MVHETKQISDKQMQILTEKLKKKETKRQGEEREGKRIARNNRGEGKKEQERYRE